MWAHVGRAHDGECAEVFDISVIEADIEITKNNAITIVTNLFLGFCIFVLS
jgi:hypothetical protein